MNYSIGEMSALTNLSIHTLRYYEKEGLLFPKRNDGNRRYYDENDYRWIQFIQRLKKVGMPIKDIKTYSDLRLQGDTTYYERLVLLESHLKLLDGNISELLENREKLIEKIAYYKEEIQKIAD
ncbi:MerR family transcriptional regulator [Streptococcus caviae]|uniref:MerR family transcriptional regulator n=1 Tax=Streptococcus sp. 'caviae' TaxID=1915004 RepID=UPI00094BA6B7|nr:MerR family transcriptional regulator [Streptococcus sp. 'caviae']OLN82325.1 MerR family transcriptional regulator [Streptococcus sp. 'caviae']